MELLVLHSIIHNQRHPIPIRISHLSTCPNRKGSTSQESRIRRTLWHHHRIGELYRSPIRNNAMETVSPLSISLGNKLCYSRQYTLLCIINLDPQRKDGIIFPMEKLLGFVGVPPKEVLDEFKELNPIDLDIPRADISINIAHSYLPKTFCATLRTVLANAITLAPYIEVFICLLYTSPSPRD